jgi:ADP-ribosylglycohydrolase
MYEDLDEFKKMVNAKKSLIMSVKYKLYGAILGDLAGQPYEFPIMQGPYTNVKIHNPESHFTDDTLMTLATARAMLDDISFEQAYKEMGKMYQGDYYGKGFKEWIESPDGTIGNSYANGCLMRISPLMYLPNEGKEFKVVESCLNSHVNPISICSSVRLHDLYRYGPTMKQNGMRKFNPEPFTKFTVKADDTFSFIFHLYSSCNSTKTAIIKAIECGGDTDTNASIIGELMNYTYNDITRRNAKYVESKLDPYLLSILKEFNKKFKKA